MKVQINIYFGVVVGLCLLLSSCTVTETVLYNYQDYYRKNIETPAQLTAIEPVTAPLLHQKGDISISGSMTVSGKDVEDPRKTYSEPEGKAKLESLQYFTGSVAYGLNDKWTLHGQFTGGNDRHTIDINAMQAVIYDVDLYWSWIFLIPPDYVAPIEFTTGIDKPVGLIQSVERAYQYRQGFLGATYKLHTGNHGGIYSVSGGAGMGNAQLTGTTHADNQKAYSNNYHAVPATYGSHQNRYWSAYLQPNVGVSLKKWIETGASLRVAFFQNNLNSHIEGIGLKYKETVHTTLFQPAVFLRVGPPAFKITAEYLGVLPIANKTNQHFNGSYFNIGMMFNLPTTTPKTITTEL